MYAMALRPSCWLPRETVSLRRCACCQGKVDEQDNVISIRCACGSCVYCSVNCRRNDLSEHEARCDVIIQMTEDINDHATHLENRLAHFDQSLENDYPENLFEFGVREDDRDLCLSFAMTYFVSRQRLIEVLISEGLARTTINDLAFEIAINECKHLFILDKYDSYYSRADGLLPKKEILMNLFLFTERYQELYNLCCFYASNGEKYFSHYSPWYIEQIGSPNRLLKQDITKSFFLDNNLHHESFPVTALNHMYIMKQMIHENMEVLSWIDSHFLNSFDCVSTIGEFLGVKREWIVFETDWYKIQALEILRLFVGCKASEAEFGKLCGYSELFFRCANFQKMSCLITDSPQIDTLQSQVNGCLRHTNGNETSRQLHSWKDTLLLCKNDHSICLYYILPWFEVAVAKLNEIAGYDAISTNIDQLAWAGSTQ